MSERRITKEDAVLLNTKEGLHALLKNKNLDLAKTIEEVKYSIKIRKKHEELIKLQNWVIKNDKKVVILFEGRDAAGKGGAIRRITEHINPRHFRIVALNIPTKDERKQWFFQR